MNDVGHVALSPWAKRDFADSQRWIREEQLGHAQNLQTSRARPAGLDFLKTSGAQLRSCFRPR